MKIRGAIYQGERGPVFLLWVGTREFAWPDRRKVRRDRIEGGTLDKTRLGAPDRYTHDAVARW